MKIGELSKKTGLSRDAIRFYERNGLIESEPSTSETNTFRNYPEGLVFRIGVIQKARDAGVSVSEIKALFAALNGSCSPKKAKKIAEAKIAELEASKINIEQTISFLKAQFANL